MAFDRPLEADRVDNLGLLSAFVRAPIVGPIMWILGKQFAGDEEDLFEEKENTIFTNKYFKQSSLDQNDEQPFPVLSSNNILDNVNDPSIDIEEHRCNSNDGILRDKSTNLSLLENSSMNEEIMSLRRKKKYRKMSWSDESGQDLVEYCNMSQSSSSHQGSPISSFYPAHKKRPIKSAMKRSSSNKTPLHPDQNIPSGLAGGSIIMPTGGGLQQIPNRNQVNNNISPQYGWYISMTPPTPPHYHIPSSSSSSQHAIPAPSLQHPQHNGSKFYPQNTKSVHILQRNNDNHQTIRTAAKTTVASKPVFKRSLKGIPNNTYGWPSVPM